MRTKNSAVDFPGLRENDNAVATLTSRKPVNRKIMHGEGIDKPKQLSHLKGEKITINNKSVSKSKLKGLCGNCDFVDSCIYSKPVTGIWHCNEYQ